ncbi:Spc7 kinetochore protein-domain-containing protein [Earliella scabrosa]|nr:Spc7 kinetochore protein-domain-containing protein [Earliella scabrosa]
MAKHSPNRRRSIATLGHGYSKSTTSHRRRAYSIAPGERLSPAAKARRLLVPRKSILKASLNLPHGRPSDAGESSSSGAADDANFTQTMDFTEVHGNGPRKSLARRVSFAAHTHVRLFHIQSPNGDNSSPAAPSPDADAPAFISRAENDENAIPSQAARRSSMRRRSSGAFSEFGERSMDMDTDDTALYPQDFLPQRGAPVDGSAVEDDFTDEEDDGSDMEVTEAIARNIERKRSLSMGGARASLSGPSHRRSSVVTVTQHQSENQPPMVPEDDAGGVENEESYMDDATTSSAHTGSSYVSEDSTGEPMEFTIPVLQSMRQPKEPDPVWLQLRAMTHAGSEPYEPPPPESDDDALLIQPSPGQGQYGPPQHNQAMAHGDEDDDGGTQDMDLTSAVTRLHRARASLGLRDVDDDDDDSFGDDQAQDMHDDTFSTEDSFGNESADLNNQTINFTQRTSLGTLEDTSLDAPDEADRVVKLSVTPGSAPARETSSHAATSSQGPAPEPLRSSVFSAPTSSVPASSSVFSAPTSAPLSSSVFSAPTSASLSSTVFSAPPPTSAPKPSSHPPRSPSKSPGPATVPKPFTFSLPRAGSPSKTPAQGKPTIQLQPHRGTAAFAPPSVPKSPKRPNDGNAGPSSVQRPSVGRLDPSRTAAFEATAETASQPVAGANANRRASISAVRRTSGYFAQRKSLGAGVLPPNPNAARASSPDKVSGGAGLSKPRASMGAHPSGVGLGLPLSRTSSDPGPAAANHAQTLYPDLSQLAPGDQRPTSPAPIATQDKGKGRACDREEARQAIAAPSPTRGSPAPASPRAGSPALLQRPASPAPVSTVRGPLVTHIGQPSGPQRVIDVSMAMDVDLDASDPPPPVGAGVSQSWREGVPEEPIQDEDGPTISIEQFFQMTGIRFMDELTMPRPRRSTVGPGQLRPRARRRSSATEDLGASAADEDPVPLSEFAIAMAVDMPHLDLYTAIARDLTAYIQECKKIYKEAEEEALKDTPSLFREFASVDESEQAMLIHQLKLIKANNIGTAKSQWYDWKLQWVEQLYESAAQGFTSLESDATYLAGVIKEAQDMLPELRQEYEEVTRLLAQEQADIDEIENSDKDFLNELKATIAEQSTEIEVFRADVSEAKAKLERLEEKLAEIESQKEEATTAINQARHVVYIQKESTSAEVFRLKAELEALEEMHLWHTLKLSPDLVEFVYGNKYHVSIPCQRYTPVCPHVRVTKSTQTKLKERDSFPHFTSLIVKTAQALITEAHEKLDLKQIIERLSDFWSSCAQLRSQFTFLGIKYPLQVEGVTDEHGHDYLRATATVMLPRVKGKTYISFILDKDTFTRWPLSVRGLKVDAKVAYGDVQDEVILQGLLENLSGVTPARTFGCLLDACVDATSQFVPNID